MRACRSRSPCRSVRTSMMLRPCHGSASASASSAVVLTARCATPYAAASAARSTACGVPKRRSTASRSGPASTAPCSRSPKMAPPASLRTTIRRSGTASPAPSRSPPASCRKVTSPSRTRGFLPAAERDAGGGGDGAVDPGQAAVGEDGGRRFGGGRAGEVDVADTVRGAQHQLAAGVLPDQRRPRPGRWPPALPRPEHAVHGVLGGGTRRAARHRARRRAAAGEVGQVGQVVQRQFGAPAGLVPGHRDRLVQGGGDVRAGQQGAEPAGRGWAGRRAPPVRSAAPTPGPKCSSSSR